MKKIVLLSVFAFAYWGLYAQRIEVKEVKAVFEKERHNALSTTVYYADAKTVEKEFNSLIKGYKGKISKKKEVIFGDDLFVATISNNAFDVYATISKVKGTDDIELIVAFDLGGAYLSSSDHPDQYDRAVRIIKDFALSLTNKAYAEKLKNEEKNVQKVQKEYDELIKSKEKLEKENEDYKKRITKNEKAVEDYVKKIDTQKTELDNLKKSFEEMQKDASKIR
jgi:molecular chaperone DnaK (HSP70)